MKKKYDVEVKTDGTTWSALLTCHCGETPEQTRVQALTLRDLMWAVTDTLVKHEKHELNVK